MKRILGHVASLFAIGLAVSAAMPACATNDQTLFIHSVLAPAAQRTNGQCIYTTDPQQTKLSTGRLDLALSDSYRAILLVGNQLIQRGDPQNNRAESNRAHINGAIVKIAETDGRVLREFTSYGSALAEPQSNNNPGFAVYDVIAVDPIGSAALKGTVGNRRTTHTVLITIKAFGTTLGGQDIESGEFQMPLEVCNGCLVDFTQGYEPTSMKQPLNCDKALAAANGGSTQGVPCITGQDEYINCQLCKGNPACDPANP